MWVSDLYGEPVGIRTRDLLIKSFLFSVSGIDQEKFALFGSAAIPLNGVDLRREINDLDVFVSDETFKNLAPRFELKHKEGKGDEPPVRFTCLRRKSRF